MGIKPLLLLAGCVVGVTLVVRFFAQEVVSQEVWIEEPVALTPPGAVPVKRADEAWSRETFVPSARAEPSLVLRSEAVRPEVSDDLEVNPGESSRVVFALDELENRLGANSWDELRSNANSGDRFARPESPLEREDDVEFGVVFSLNQEAKEVSIEKNSLGRLIEAVKAQKKKKAEAQE